MANNQVVYGIVKSRANAEQIVRDLVNSGITHEHISFLSQQNEEFSDFDSATSSNERNWRAEERNPEFPNGKTRGTTYNSGTSEFSRTNPRTTEDTSFTKSKKNTKGGLGIEKNSKAPEGAVTGATTGGIVGGTLGLLAGIGALAIPGFGALIAAGPILGALSGLGAGGVLGGLIGGLVGAGIPENEAKYYENGLKKGGILLSVRVFNDADAKKAKEIMKKNGAENVTCTTPATTSKNSFR